jgi:hypothetical protein
MLLEDLLDHIPAQEGHMLDRGNGTQIDHIPLKGREPSSFVFSKVNGLPQGLTGLSALLKITVQDDKLRCSSRRQGHETTSEFPSHGQLIPLSATSGTGAFISFPDYVIIDGPSMILGLSMLGAHQTQSMIQIACRRYCRYPLSFDRVN